MSMTLFVHLESLFSQEGPRFLPRVLTSLYQLQTRGFAIELVRQAQAPGPRRQKLTHNLELIAEEKLWNKITEFSGSFTESQFLKDFKERFPTGEFAYIYKSGGITLVRPGSGQPEQQFPQWQDLVRFLLDHKREALVERKTAETSIYVKLNLDGTGKKEISTGLPFFDHMLEQVALHSLCDLTIRVTGDLAVDEHHTIEDTALALGRAFKEALGDKRGIRRYGFLLPMDESLAQIALDFSARPYLVWEAEFRRERVGDVPTEMFKHFFKSFSDAAGLTLHISVKGENEHHKAEAIFKAFAKTLRQAVGLDSQTDLLASTKGTLND